MVTIRDVLAALAARDLSCLRPPLGCGGSMYASQYQDLTEAQVREWRISGLCPGCQDSDPGADDGEESHG